MSITARGGYQIIDLGNIEVPFDEAEGAYVLENSEIYDLIKSAYQKKPMLFYGGVFVVEDEPISLHEFASVNFGEGPSDTFFAIKTPFIDGIIITQGSK